MSLKDVFCQDRAIGLLQRGLAADRAAHAYLFAGPDGVGKYKTACEWARLLLCQNPICSTPAPGGGPSRGRLGYIEGSQHGAEGPFADSCGSCQSCTLMDAGSHPDYAHVYKELLQYTEGNKDKKTPVELAIDVIREFLIEQVAGRPTLSKRKVYIVSEAEKLNANSQNALLKVLEEPPSYCTIILLCTRLEELLPTIRSRCQLIRFGPVEEGRIIEQLKAEGLGSTEATFFARLAQGSLGLACQWSRLERDGAGLFASKRQLVVSLTDLNLADVPAIVERIQEAIKELAAAWGSLDKATSKSDLTRRAQKTMIRILIGALYDVTIHHVAPQRALVNADQGAQIAALARRLGPEQAIEGVREGCEMLRWLEDNTNERLILERLLFRLSRAAIMAGPC
ncbi:MAG: DNA polymerase III subunit [Phycisphaerae bacterium]|nr:DNA polymerase III subunit [Phycisphaerae bacterium]